MKLFLLAVVHALLLLKVSEVVSAKKLRFTDETDKQALLEFKSRVSENSRAILASWNESLPLCQWDWVTCGLKHKRVTSLNLMGLRLSGIVSPFIGNLSFLRSFDLSNNYFHGTIPREVGKLFRLHYLNMSINFLTGGIPVDLSNCSSLLTLDLSVNNLEGDVPSEIGSLRTLVLLLLRRNNLTGMFPVSLGNLTSLQALDFTYNHMEGEIPDSIGRLTKMVLFQIAVNNFSGVFPPAIYNLSSLVYLSMSFNRFSGNIRPDLGTLLHNLYALVLGANHFTGIIPPTLFNVSTIRTFDITLNHMTGGIPLGFGKLRNLQILGVAFNSLGNNSSSDLEFLSVLTNCTQLRYLDVGYNRLGGELPSLIGNLSTRLTILSLEGNLISGSIPPEFGNLISLQTLGLGRNVLTGKLPSLFGKLSGLGILSLRSNRISGEIPPSLGNISGLLYLHLYNNSFEGSIPPILGNCSYLQHLHLGSNKLTSTIPHQLLELSSLVSFNVSHNSLTGLLPEDIGKWKQLLEIDVSYNELSGRIPESLGNCLSMDYLYLQGNSFEGGIPDIRMLNGLKSVDLSDNNISGSIPAYSVNFSSLLYLNLSMNNLEGPVPMEGIFRNVSAVSIFGNKKLCGGIPAFQLEPCSVLFPIRPRRHSTVGTKIVIIVSSVTSLFLLLLIVIYLSCYKKKKKNNNTQITSDSLLEPFYERISYEELHKATNGFSSSNLIGSGNFGSVFKGFLGLGKMTIAVKVLNLQKQGAAKTFMAECKALRGIRHRNLVKLVTACSSIDFKGNEFRALVYEFMSNGNLDMWLHLDGVEGTCNHLRSLTLLERINIAIDVACVLAYLHAYSHSTIVHCDLKPSNILLNDDMTAHVSDFGLAHILLKSGLESFHDDFSSAGIRGTIGYAAPEYGMGCQPSTTGDAYSFGILLLELFTGKRPTDELFTEDFTLYSFTKSALPEKVLDIIDRSILHSADAQTGIVEMSECLKRVFHVGIRCSEEHPTDRLTMAEAVKKLEYIRDRFFGDKVTGRWKSYT